MNKFKKMFYIWLFLGLIIILFHPTVYYFYVSKVFPKDNSVVGDLSRMTYSVDLIDKKFEKISLEKLHIKQNEYEGQNIDFITIGDSFSQGASGGLNPYYQDYIATLYNKNVLNIEAFKESKNYIETIYSLLNSGELEKRAVKYVLIESVQRRSLERFSVNDINTSLSIDKSLLRNNIKINYNIQEITSANDTLIDIIKKLFSKSTNNDISVINNLNQNALIYNLRFKIKGYGKMTSHVYREKLSQDLFSKDISGDLLFYYEDLKYLGLETKQNIELLNDNFNKLSHALAKKNIKLIFMPAVDKYNLYRPYIVSNIYNESIFFEYLETLPKDYIFINTKKILSKELEKGEKDIFYVDDTHWSYKASKTIIKDESFKNIFN
ncbi:MAG: hypothetical protein H6630_08100 [Arcobacter sp.]|nr:hypothetical protein [Arcobacter sp.]